ncbi:Crp/Fnr family transcriptional regulator [Zunongwangia sp. HRR-M8]|uniref:Crp/Fnr family transcriptional regulator n=1 Tax=Zunongwangia sp. HRR-M8 TaxID=3015170 RepID=UPI0022DE74EE|nr:Crp/Fnr family transcriptional regulator [Zunongwangia sp. HRR-M8]WBL23856.1 Crp/Fnr family transcriptional regulator [Zunongwangia sp. HRR-M8]
MKEQIRKYFSRYVEFSNSEIDDIYSKLTFKTIQKKDYILKEGQVCKNNYFIINGLVRSFYIDNKGNEKITQFALENWWITNMESFINQTPSLSSIQALEKTQILIFNKEDIENLYVSIPKLERLFRIITENMLIAIQRRNDIYLQMKSKDRYDNLISYFPDFTQRVPQYMIASYLEITPEYLSELRKTN